MKDVITVGLGSARFWRDEAAAAHHEVGVGLPDEYGKEVADRLALEAQASGLVGGLAVGQAAPSLVGSSLIFFAALSSLVVRLIVDRFDEEPPEVIDEVIRDAMTRLRVSLAEEHARDAVASVLDFLHGAGVDPGRTREKIAREGIDA